MNSGIDMIKLQPFSLTKLYSEEHFSIVNNLSLNLGFPYTCISIKSQMDLLWKFQKDSHLSLYLRTLLKSDFPIQDNHKTYNIHITVFALTPSLSPWHLVLISKQSWSLRILTISLNPFTTYTKYKHGRVFFLLCTSFMYWYVTDFTV